jgi:hypothetical protein
MDSLTLQSLSYPIYKLPDKPNIDDGVMYYYSEIEKEDITQGKLCLIDDISIEGDSLAKRRLRLLADGVPLFKLKNALFFLGDLIKIANPKTWFIDSNGKLFNYKKTTSVKLDFHKITKIIPIQTGGAIIEVDGIPNRFKVLHTPIAAEKCAGILHMGLATVLYGLYSSIPETTRRMV